ncbi:MAG: LEA type 2 family protein [Bacteroidetes bacterium]|nr:LEA type 2 family protein [Bacteroidota bacterium]
MIRLFAMRTSLLPLIYFLLLSSCFTIQPVEYKKAEHFTFTNNDQAVEMTFDLNMSNPNHWSLRLADVQADVFIDGQLLTKANMTSTTRLKKNSDFTLPVLAKSSVNDLVNLSSIGIGLLLGNQTATATIKGNMTLKKFIFRKKILFEYQEKIDSKSLQSLF